MGDAEVKRFRALTYSALPDLPTDWPPHRSGHVRKKTVVDGQVCVVKVDGVKSTWQAEVDRLKPVFGLRPIGATNFWSPEHHNLGVILPWHDHLGTLARLPMSVWVQPAAIRELLKITLLDWVIGNDDRTGSNVLVLPDRQLLAIDEGNAGAPPRQMAHEPWIRFHPGITRLLRREVGSVWFSAYVEEVRLRPMDTTLAYVRTRFHGIGRWTIQAIKEALDRDERDTGTAEWVSGETAVFARGRER